MSATAPLLAELQKLDVRLAPAGDCLEVDAPEGVLTAVLEAEIVRLKPDILRALLAARESIARLDHGLAVREVLTFPAALLGQLPLPTTLVINIPGGGHVTVATHPGCGRADLRPTDWLAWCAAVPGGTVAEVLATRGSTLRLVVVEGER